VGERTGLRVTQPQITALGDTAWGASAAMSASRITSGSSERFSNSRSVGGRWPVVSHGPRTILLPSSLTQNKEMMS
jgi:hypothetical protein